MNSHTRYLDPLRHVKFFAAVKHGDQKYSGGLPYTHHLAAVEAVLRRFEPDIRATLARTMFVKHVSAVGMPLGEDAFTCSEFEQLLAAAWLHDVVEDTSGTSQETKCKDVAEMFGDSVADLVAAVTEFEQILTAAWLHDVIEDAGGTSQETYPKIRSVRGAVALKLADRIANVEAGGSLVAMYQEEYEDFRRALHTAGEYEATWAHLDALLRPAAESKTDEGPIILKRARSRSRP